MNWYWRVRIYNNQGKYWHGQIKTGLDLREIDGIQDFYEMMTGCKMLLEGMSDESNEGLDDIFEAFCGLWVNTNKSGDRGPPDFFCGTSVKGAA